MFAAVLSTRYVGLDLAHMFGRRVAVAIGRESIFQHFRAVRVQSTTARSNPLLLQTAIFRTVSQLSLAPESHRVLLGTLGDMMMG